MLIYFSFYIFHWKCLLIMKNLRNISLLTNSGSRLYPVQCVCNHFTCDYLLHMYFKPYCCATSLQCNLVVQFFSWAIRRIILWILALSVSVVSLWLFLFCTDNVPLDYFNVFFFFFLSPFWSLSTIYLYVRTLEKRLRGLPTRRKSFKWELRSCIKLWVS